MQIGSHEKKIVNFVDCSTIFLVRDITCLNKIQVILKRYEYAPILKIKFSKANLYQLEHIQRELINQDKWNGHIFSLKYLGVRGTSTNNFRHA